MKISTMIFIAMVVVVTLIVVFYVFFTPTVVAHSLFLGETSLYKSSDPIVASSDGVDTVIYATDKGVVSYNTNTGDEKIINTTPSKDVKGLAYVGNGFLMLNRAGAFIRLKDGTLLQMGGEALYDTIGGYYQRVDGVEASTNGWEPANGNYGLIKLKIT